MADKEERRIVSAKLDIYDNADDDLFAGLDKTQIAILKAVMGIMNQQNVEGGKLVINESTTMLLNQLNKDVRRIMQRSTYDDKVSAYLRKFEKIDKLNIELHSMVNDIKLAKINLNPVKTDTINNLTAQLISTQAKDINLSTPIKQIMFETITTGMTLDEARSVLTTFITGDEKRLGHLQRYVSQIARDAVTQYDGKVNSIIAEQYGLTAYRYVGSLIEDSRPQCVRWVGLGVLPIETLQCEIDWAMKGTCRTKLKPVPAAPQGHGMIPGTDVNNFATFRGGYNCRHMAIPFRK